MEQYFRRLFSSTVMCGVRQGGVLSPYLFAVYINDLIGELRDSGYEIHVGSLFVGCLFYADDIVLLFPSCYGLQKLINVCEHFASTWDIKFNPAKSQLITFGGKTPHDNKMYISGTAIPAGHLHLLQVKHIRHF